MRRRITRAALRLGVVVAVGIGILGIWLYSDRLSPLWDAYHTNREDLTPLVTIVGALVAAFVALKQVQIALRQASTQFWRHQAQTKADRQRRLTESFSKAIEQIGSEKIEVRLGGIYTLEKISRESKRDYWTIIESLTAFLRERSQRHEAEFDERVAKRAFFLWREAGCPGGRSEEFWSDAFKIEWDSRPPTDIAAAISVLQRRRKKSVARERKRGWRLDLTGAVLRQANLEDINLEEAWLTGANLAGAFLTRANLKKVSMEGIHLEEAKIDGANLEEAYLADAHLQDASLTEANLKGATLIEAHLERANLRKANMAGASLIGAYLEETLFHQAHLEGAKLSGFSERLPEETDEITQEQLASALGNSKTIIPPHLSRPSHWA